MMLEEIIENYSDVDILKADGFDSAVIGVSNDFTAPRLIYSVAKCLAILTENPDMDVKDALEYFSFNISGAYIGELTPIWCWDIY